MADDKLKTGLEEQQVPESPGPAEPGGSPTPEQPAPEHPGPEAPQEENTPAAPSGKVIDLTEARAAGEKTAEGPAVEEGSPKHGDEAFRDLFGNEEKPPWEKSLDEIKEEENAQKRRGRPKKAKDKVEPNKPEKGPGTRKGRPAKADKAALDKSPAPGVLDKVVCTPSSRQRNNLHFTHENPSCIPYGAGCYAASRRSWTSIGVRTPRPRWRRWKL